MDIVNPAFVVTLTGPFHHNTTSGYATPTLLELGNVLLNRILNLRGGSHPLKHDFRRRLHMMLPSQLFIAIASYPTLALCPSKCHFRLGIPLFPILGDLGHRRLGEQQHACHRYGIFEGDAHDLCRVDNSGLDQIDIFLAASV